MAIETLKLNILIADDAGFLGNFSGGKTNKLQVFLSPYYKVGLFFLDPEQAFEINVTLVQHIIAAFFDWDHVQYIDIVHTAV